MHDLTRCLRDVSFLPEIVYSFQASHSFIKPHSNATCSNPFAYPTHPSWFFCISSSTGIPFFEQQKSSQQAFLLLQLISPASSWSVCSLWISSSMSHSLKQHTSSVGAQCYWSRMGLHHVHQMPWSCYLLDSIFFFKYQGSPSVAWLSCFALLFAYLQTLLTSFTFNSSSLLFITTWVIK